MNTLYFVFFCFVIGYVIFWAMQNDDQAEFTGQERSKRFFVNKKTQNDMEEKEISEQ